MPNAKEELAEKKRKLQELIRARSKATCSSVVSTEIDVRRETEIEERPGAHSETADQVPTDLTNGPTSSTEAGGEAAGTLGVIETIIIVELWIMACVFGHGL